MTTLDERLELAPTEPTDADEIDAAFLTLTIDPAPGSAQGVESRGVKMEITEKVLGGQFRTQEELEIVVVELTAAMVVRLQNWIPGPEIGQAEAAGEEPEGGLEGAGDTAVSAS